MATPITPGAGGTATGTGPGFWRRRNLIIIAAIVVAILGFLFFRGCFGGKKTPDVIKKEEPEKEKGEKPTIVVTMEPADGKVVPEIGTLKFTFTESVKTDKVKVKITDPKGKSLEGSRSGFDAKLLSWVLTERSIEPGNHKISVESSEKEFETANYTLTVATPQPPTPGTGEDLSVDQIFREAVDKALKGE